MDITGEVKHVYLFWHRKFLAETSISSNSNHARSIKFNIFVCQKKQSCASSIINSHKYNDSI